MATIELRCDGTMHGIVDTDVHTIEVKCKRRGCGAEPGVVVLHTFDLDSAQIIQTQRFQQPHPRKE